MKYAYPAIFTKDEAGYSVEFPDVAGCYTSGETLPEAVEMAADALCLMLYDMEEDGEELPTATAFGEIHVGEGQVVSIVACDTLEYRKLYDNKEIKKTLSVPAWLNTLAERQGVNFSQVLQSALKQAVNVEG